VAETDNALEWRGYATDLLPYSHYPSGERRFESHLPHSQQPMRLVIFGLCDEDHRLLRRRGRLPVLRLLHAFHQ
jgi:hypothetical protein